MHVCPWKKDKNKNNWHKYIIIELPTKPTKWHVCPAKTQISLGIHPVWSESSLSAWRKLGSLSTHWVQAKTLIRLGGCPGWPESLLGAHFVGFVMRWLSYNKVVYSFVHDISYNITRPHISMWQKINNVISTLLIHTLFPCAFCLCA